MANPESDLDENKQQSAQGETEKSNLESGDGALMNGDSKNLFSFKNVYDFEGHVFNQLWGYFVNENF